MEILRGLRAAEFDILVGINLLREGLDLPEVSLVCILDADKEGYLRSETSLIQTAGRAARHVNGEVVLFADQVTESIQRAPRHQRIPAGASRPTTTNGTASRPQSVKRAVQESLRVYVRGKEIVRSLVAEDGQDFDTLEVIRELEEEMQEAAQKLEYERAALIRDQINELKKKTGQPELKVKRKAVRYSEKRR